MFQMFIWYKYIGYNLCNLQVKVLVQRKISEKWNDFEENA